MSPRNFEKVSKLPKPILEDRVAKAPNLWYAFTAITNIDKIFSYTADGITINPAKDSKKGIDNKSL